ncbi:MAG: SWF/SNF helicase family protein [Candidatus Wallbacteria bacterium]|nr:SWF/SNF helicase family protein [Candidatus Wallbacteria bacterium]
MEGLEHDNFAPLRKLVHPYLLRRLKSDKTVIPDLPEKIEVTEPLATHLGDVFGRRGLVLTRDTQMQARRVLVERFQQDDDVPFLVPTLKTGGVGLNLTAASHVIHFDGWWNPAVESQATDRVYRIGQRRNVLVHKLVCRGTIEERVDRMLACKQRLSDEVLQSNGEALLTEMSTEELLEVILLDVRTAFEEEGL